MARYDAARMERATRDLVARASYLEIMAGRGTPAGGVLLDASPLGAEFVARNFPGMVKRCAEVGYDLTGGPVEVIPTAHFHMGGVRIDVDCRVPSLPGLLVAGEDAGGVHGANRLGGNGVADSCVFGSRAGRTAARMCAEWPFADPDEHEAAQARSEALAPLARERGESPFQIRDRLQRVMWDHVGLVRDAQGLQRALTVIAELEDRATQLVAPPGARWNLTWQQALDVRSLLTAARLTATAALHRQESRGSHARRDFPERDDARWLVNVHQARGRALWTEPVRLSRLTLDDLPTQHAARS